MAHVNNVMIIRRDLLSRMAELYKEGKLEEGIDRIPLEISRRIRNNERCCIYKARAVVKYKLMGLMGFGIEDEKDELDPLSHYARLTLDGQNPSDKYLTIVDEACTSCVKANYIVTNLCKGCIAQPCINNCPKKAITRNSDGKAFINPDHCVNCGICKEQCPYHSIVYMPVPCEESCPVNAIHKDANGVERIDEEKCILCGKCINACPFGSIIETTHLFDVMDLLKNHQAVTAVVAPSLFGQFQAKPGSIVNALLALGFTHVVEAARGAMETTRHEAAELKQRIDEGQPFMTTSCCTAWVNAAKQHLPEILPYVSSTPSPLAFAAKICKEDHPGETVVFIGPCVAKCKEARENPDVDMVMTFEELSCLLHGWNVSVVECDDMAMDASIGMLERRYCISGSVAQAVNASAGGRFTTKAINGLDKKQLRLLSAMGKTGKAEAQMVEVMSCEGGCIAGPCSYEFPKEAQKYFNQNMEAFGKDTQD